MCCRPAVERSFAELTARGVSERHAVETPLVIRTPIIPRSRSTGP